MDGGPYRQILTFLLNFRILPIMSNIRHMMNYTVLGRSQRFRVRATRILISYSAEMQTYISGKQEAMCHD
jgi:hypothetical protein